MYNLTTIRWSFLECLGPLFIWALQIDQKEGKWSFGRSRLDWGREENR